MKKFNIALTFNKEVSQKIIEYSNGLYKILDSDVILGVNSTPHMTLGQFIVEDNEAKTVWESYKSKITELPKVNLAGLAFLPTNEGDVWIEITILKSNALLNLQEVLIKTLAPYGILTNDIADNYRPHITIAHSIIGKELPKYPLDFNVLRLKSVSTELGIGLGTSFEPLKF